MITRAAQLIIYGGVLAFCTKLLGAYSVVHFLFIAAGGLLGAFCLSPSNMDDPPIARGMFLLLFCALSAFFGFSPSQSWTGVNGEYFYGILPMACVFAAYAMGSSCENLERDAVLAVALACLYGCVQAWVGEPFAGIGPLPTGRAISTAGNPVFLASVIVVALPLAAHQSRWYMVALMVLGLLASKSRGGIMAGAVGVAAYYYLRHRMVRDRVKTVALAGVVAFVALAAFVVIRRPGSDDIRLRCWRVGVVEFANTPKFMLLGSGPDTFDHVWRAGASREDSGAMPGRIHGNAHNDWLQLLVTTGILGFALYLAVQMAAVKDLVPYCAMPNVAAALGSAAGLFVFAKFSPVPLAASAMLALLLGGARAASPRVSAFPLWSMRLLCFLALWVAVCHCKAEYLLRIVAEGRARNAVHAIKLVKAASDVAPWDDEYFRNFQRSMDEAQKLSRP